MRSLTAAGQPARSTAPPADHHLPNVASHPSGELTVLTSSPSGYRLSRTRADGTALGVHDVEAPAIDADPAARHAGAPTGPITAGTRDAGRIAAIGEEVVLATRTARESVIAYRPVEAQYAVQLAVDDAGTACAIRTDGDVAFDVAEPPGRGPVVVGAAGYTQNPHGASVSEDSVAFADWLPPGGRAIALPLPAARRHNEGRFVAPSGPDRIAVGGMLDGPGTHSADA
jgi:hypothetical protein